jgi:exodeoxyribonuclease VII large subunit
MRQGMMSANQHEGHVEKLWPPLHTPTTILTIFNACLTPSETRRIIVVKGVYDKRGNREYRGYFYDRVRDEASNQSLTLKVPALVRETLQPDKIYTFEGILDRRIQDEGSIELNFVVTSCISEEAPTFSEVVHQQLELQRLYKCHFS